MHELQPYIEKYDRLTLEAMWLAVKLEEKEKELLKFRTQTLPDLLQELGIKETTFEDGRTLHVKDYATVKLPEDPNPSYEWLAERGFGALVTCNVSALLDLSDGQEKLILAQKTLKEACF